MNKRQFETYFAAAEKIGGDYMSGYRRGLRHHAHENHGDPSEHEAWMAASGARQELGDGYRDGAAGRPPRGFHGNLGNLNAQGALPADSQLQVRVNSQVKARWVKQAQREGMKLSQWVAKHLDAACDG